MSTNRRGGPVLGVWDVVLSAACVLTLVSLNYRVEQL